VKVEVAEEYIGSVAALQQKYSPNKKVSQAGKKELIEFDVSAG
jgi:hypothetical protein